MFISKNSDDPGMGWHWDLVSLTHSSLRALYVPGIVRSASRIQPIHEAKEETYAHNKQMCVCGF